MDRVAPGAEALVARLEIEAAVEIERRAILVELGADPGAVGEHEVDLRPDPTAARAGLTAAGMHFGPLCSIHSIVRQQRARLDRNAQDHLVLDDQAGDRLADVARLRGRTGRAAAAAAQESYRSH